MGSYKEEGSPPPCDFCNVRAAVLYCRADTAKLCIPCDQDVHAANTLSKKHLRSQICQVCNSHPASVRCVTHNHNHGGLLLCHECDWEAHAHPHSDHDRAAVEGFSGCPSSAELAALWGLDDVHVKKTQDVQLDLLPSYSVVIPEQYEYDPYNHQGGGGFMDFEWADLLVPSQEGLQLFPGQHKQINNLTHKKKNQQEQAVVKQLSELRNEEEESHNDKEEEEDADNSVVPGSIPILHGQTGANLSMNLAHNMNMNMNVFMNMKRVDVNHVPMANPTPVICHTSSTNTTRQIWDFNTGRTRGDEEPSGQLNISCPGNDAGILINNYSAILQETDSATSKALGEMFGMNCEDNRLFNSKCHNPATSQGAAITCESNNLPIGKPSPGSIFVKPKSGEIQFTEQALIVGGESARSTVKTKADLDLLAKNRGNAMQRYMEKKKTRRYEKQIRYESRKARADTRKRIKGRFVKASDAPTG